MISTAPRGRRDAARAPPTLRERGDLALTATILAVAALPLLLAAAGVARWDATSAGLGTLGVLFAGRELLGALVARPGAERRAP